MSQYEHRNQYVNTQIIHNPWIEKKILVMEMAFLHKSFLKLIYFRLETAWKCCSLEAEAFCNTLSCANTYIHTWDSHD